MDQKEKPVPIEPEKNQPIKPDINPDPTKIVPGKNDPEKIDPTKTPQPDKTQK